LHGALAALVSMRVGDCRKRGCQLAKYPIALIDHAAELQVGRTGVRRAHALSAFARLGSTERVLYRFPDTSRMYSLSVTNR
jgi:hypothetical protein